ncbi:acyl carrier protein [Streptacidiphilus sp. P02-A3a]|uniref:acyl carrier protein n=1 Tax=Streptacidiphilus sp. P02-A3a TaxID=2704468 RepID=UPI0015F8DC05|nr:acyl carrier protein [Streptacidiphilus sp. P02-A3a]QMU69440.1 acyl carrier protein [Streptacidiphilus sp. P02-A3a]
MSGLPLPDRAAVVAMLARYGDRPSEAVPESLGSLELTWLIAEFEQSYQIELDLDDDRLDAVRTVDDATGLLRAAVEAARTAGAART